MAGVTFGGMEFRPRSSPTNEAATGSHPIALTTTAGDSWMRTGQIHLRLAGQLFRDETATLEKRLPGGSAFYPSEMNSGDPAAPKLAEEEVQGV